MNGPFHYSEKEIKEAIARKQYGFALFMLLDFLRDLGFEDYKKEMTEKEFTSSLETIECVTFLIRKGMDVYAIPAKVMVEREEVPEEVVESSVAKPISLDDWEKMPEIEKEKIPAEPVVKHQVEKRAAGETQAMIIEKLKEGWFTIHQLGKAVGKKYPYVYSIVKDCLMNGWVEAKLEETRKPGSRTQKLYRWKQTEEMKATA